MKSKYIINLSEEERRDLEQMTSKGKTSVRKVKRAQILLPANQDKTDKAVAEALHVAAATVFRTRRRYVEPRFRSSTQ